VSGFSVSFASKIRNQFAGPMRYPLSAAGTALFLTKETFRFLPSMPSFGNLASEAIGFCHPFGLFFFVIRRIFVRRRPPLRVVAFGKSLPLCFVSGSLFSFLSAAPGLQSPFPGPESLGVLPIILCAPIPCLSSDAAASRRL